MGFFDRIIGRNRNNEGQAISKNERVDRIVPTIDVSSSEMRMIGMWWVNLDMPESLLGFPDPASLVAPDWEKKRRDRVVDYLRKGHTLAAYMGFSYCRFEDCRYPERNRLGTRDLTDGQWVWPEGLWHYVADHNVRLPDAFVANAAAHDFVVPKVTQDTPVSVDVQFWLRWVAENSSQPPAKPDACSLEEAQGICAELSTSRWCASIALEHERWRLRRESGGQSFDDFTGPISGHALRAYLFRYRQLESQSVLKFGQAQEIAAEYEKDGHAVRPFASAKDQNGNVWWALIMSGKDRPRKSLAEMDLKAIQIPQPGMALFLPEGWRVEVASGMDEPAWRSYLEKWRRR
jgi:hypothetical protein